MDGWLILFVFLHDEFDIRKYKLGLRRCKAGSFAFDSSISGKVYPGDSQSTDRIVHERQRVLHLGPFCGSGVTLVEAQRRGIVLSGRLNPIASLISSVKTHPLEEGFLDVCEEVVARFVSGDVAPVYCDFKNREHWFSAEIYEAFGPVERMFGTI